MLEQTGTNGFRVLVAAGVVLIIGALQAAEAVLVPLAYSVLLTALLASPVAWLQRRGAPSVVAVAVVVLGVFAAGLVGMSFLTGAVQGFAEDLPAYRDLLDERWKEAVAWLDTRGVDLQAALDDGVVDPGSVLSSVGSLLSSLLSAASDLLMVSLLAAFLLLEGDAMVAKIRLAFDDRELTEAFLNSGESLQAYLVIKTATSAFTGALAGVGLWIGGIDHALLWAFTAFLFNYIPTIGSIVAAVPPVLLAVVLGGPFDAVAVGAWYLAINTFVGNIVEPRVMGDQLGLSSFVVLLALLAWGWLWGVNGMLLSVPLTVLLRQLLSTQPDTRWIAVLMGPDPREGADAAVS